jgi:predicted dehydrogenase
MVEVAGVAREARRIRVGLVGAGNWAFHGHLRVLDLLPDYEVVAVYARRRELPRRPRSATASSISRSRSPTSSRCRTSKW